MPSLEPRMNDLQHSLVKSALQIAFEKGRHFSSADAVDDYLKEAGVSVQLLAKHGREIFNCYLSLQAELQGRRQPLSPPLSVEGSQLNAPDGPIERDNCSDQSDTVAPTFDSHASLLNRQFFFRPRFNEFDLLTAKNCKGNVSYISEKTVRKHHLRKGARSTILTWRYTGGPQSNEKYKTRCEVVRPELLPDCDIAFAEECGMQDSESSGEDEEDDEDSTESVNRPQRNDIGIPSAH
ncbi:uncharacterized protein PAC_08464 [Phialocephala subalpina]|uniref:Uncharacterized protein n=1 Tax=Phialocephala subalpina TaxID=576137 RepID=A0A1L7X0M4_9HELO|nr:uncharacterized protein PAC_08464 [Phialocephala subalpina]